jgi:hypothetical protein
MKNDLRTKKHKRIVSDYDKIKNNHLEKLANEMLKVSEKNDKLKELKINDKFLDLF